MRIKQASQISPQEKNTQVEYKYNFNIVTISIQCRNYTQLSVFFSEGAFDPYSEMCLSRDVFFKPFIRPSKAEKFSLKRRVTIKETARKAVNNEMMEYFNNAKEEM